MRSDIEFFGDFPELLEPDVNWGKEVLAHFGLLFSGYALLEAALQNAVVYWSKLELLRSFDRSTSAQQRIELWEKDHDRADKLAVASTFGSLLKLLKDCTHLNSIRSELEALKVKRDYFAHHFFRETATIHDSEELQLKMVLSMDALRQRVKSAEMIVDAAVEEMFVMMYPKKNLDVVTKAEVVKEKERISLERTIEGVRFGWEDDHAL